jgi:hypothetical protein
VNVDTSGSLSARAPVERRRLPRMTTTIPAFIRIHDDLPLHPCTVLDISVTGGRLRLDNEIMVPDQFVLLFTPTGTVQRQCRVVWRQDCYLGVAFAGRFDPHMPGIEQK